MAPRIAPRRAPRIVFDEPADVGCTPFKAFCISFAVVFGFTLGLALAKRG